MDELILSSPRVSRKYIFTFQVRLNILAYLEKRIYVCVCLFYEDTIFILRFWEQGSTDLSNSPNI